MNDIVGNKETWTKGRQLTFCPFHFIMANTPLTLEGKMWILEQLHGRFYLQGDPEIPQWAMVESTHTVFFEDPQEAMLYELTWS